MVNDMICMACIIDKKISKLRTVEIHNFELLDGTVNFPLIGNDKAFSYFVEGDRFDLVPLYPPQRLLAEVISISKDGYVNARFI